MTTTARRTLPHSATSLLPRKAGQRIRIRLSVGDTVAYKSVHRTMSREEARDLSARLYADHLRGIAPVLLLDSGEAVELDLDSAGLLDWLGRLDKVIDSSDLYGGILGR